MKTFFDEFWDLLSYYNAYKNEVIFVGDFNIHVNKPTDVSTKKLTELLDLFGLQQHITSPTHRGGNTLDLVITRETSILDNCIVMK
jgi:exonuclease III